MTSLWRHKSISLIQWIVLCIVHLPGIRHGQSSRTVHVRISWGPSDSPWPRTPWCSSYHLPEIDKFLDFFLYQQHSKPFRSIKKFQVKISKIFSQRNFKSRDISYVIYRHTGASMKNDEFFTLYLLNTNCKSHKGRVMWKTPSVRYFK